MFTIGMARYLCRVEEKLKTAERDGTNAKLLLHVPAVMYLIDSGHLIWDVGFGSVYLYLYLYWKYRQLCNGDGIWNLRFGNLDDLFMIGVWDLLFGIWDVRWVIFYLGFRTWGLVFGVRILGWRMTEYAVRWWIWDMWLEIWDLWLGMRDL